MRLDLSRERKHRSTGIILEIEDLDHGPIRANRIAAGPA